MTRKPFKIALYLMAIFFFLSQSVFALNIVELSPGYYPNTSKGRPLALAYIYVGKPDLDPTVVANQKTLSVQQEDGTIVAVTQPIRTNAGGVPTYLGESVVLLVEGDYSLTVKDSGGSQIYYVPSTAYEQYLVAGNYYYPDYSIADHGVVGAGSTVTDILTNVGAATNATMYFSHNSGAATTTYTFLTDTTITHNYSVIIEKGVVFAIAVAKTLTIDSEMLGANPTYSGAGSVISYPSPLELQRAQFSWHDGDEIHIGAGVYRHSITHQIVYWNSELTFHLESAGSNGDSDDFAADGWHYIYIDDSAVVTNASPLLDASCFLNVTGVNADPVWSATKRAWVGDGVGTATANDRCIFAVYETGDAIREFWHDGGDYVAFSTERGVLDEDVDNTFEDVACTTGAPGFSTMLRAQAQLAIKTTNAYVTARWRVNGSTEATGVLFLYETRAGTDLNEQGEFRFSTDSSQIFEVKTSRDGADELYIAVVGWYLPNGM